MAFNNRNGLSKKPNSTANLLGLSNETPISAPRTNISENLMSLVEKPYDEALFFDNDQAHVDNVALCGPKIKAVKVAGSEGTPAVSIRFTKEQRATYPYAKLIDSLSKEGKEAANLITRIILANGLDKDGKEDVSKQVERLDPGSGIQDETMDILQDWVEERKGKKLAVLFDYDRTLTVIEGGFFLRPSFAELKAFLKTFSQKEPYDFQNYVDLLTPEGFTEYYVGGRARLALLQEMFDYLYENKIDVFLLTNNSGCPKNKGMFEEVMNVLTKNRPFQIICGADYKYDKRAAIQKQKNLTPGAPLKGLCVKSGGARKKKTRAARKKRRTTRKY